MRWAYCRLKWWNVMGVGIESLWGVVDSDVWVNWGVRNTVNNLECCFCSPILDLILQVSETQCPTQFNQATRLKQQSLLSCWTSQKTDPQFCKYKIFWFFHIRKKYIFTSNTRTVKTPQHLLHQLFSLRTLLEAHAQTFNSLASTSAAFWFAFWLALAKWNIFFYLLVNICKTRQVIWCVLSASTGLEHLCFCFSFSFSYDNVKLHTGGIYCIYYTVLW